MPRYLLVKPAKGVSVPDPHADRRYVGKPNMTSPIWAADEEPVAVVVLDDPALRKAARKERNDGTAVASPGLVILGERVADNLEAARAALQPAPPAVKSGKDK